MRESLCLETALGFSSLAVVLPSPIAAVWMTNPSNLVSQPSRVNCGTPKMWTPDFLFSQDTPMLQSGHISLIRTLSSRLHDSIVALPAGLSPLQLCGLEQGQHTFYVRPDGDECQDKPQLSMKFDIILKRFDKSV